MRRAASPLLLGTLIGLFTLLFFHQVLAGRVFVQTDFHQTFEPQQSCVRDAVARGSVLWNPRLSNGTPLVANPIYAALYPPRWLIAALEPAIGLTLLGVAHVLWGALGTLILARRYRLGGSAALTAALAFGFSGLTISATAPCAYGWTLAWEPWLLLGFESVLTSSRRRRAVLALALTVFFVLVAGEPFVIVGALIGMAARWVLAYPTDTAVERRRGLLAALIAMALGVVAALPHIVAASRLFPSTVRASGFKISGVLQWSLHPLELIGLVVSDPFGDPTTYGPLAFWGQKLVEPRGHFLFQGNYVGALVLVLAVVGLAHSGRLRLAFSAWFGALLFMALGRYGPVYPVLIAIDESLVDSIRYPAKWLVPAMLPLALLAALGVARLGEVAGWRRPALIMLAALIVLAFVSATIPLGVDRWLASYSGAVSLALVLVARDLLLSRVALAAAPLLLATIAVLCAMRGYLDRRRVALVVVLLVAADLWLNNRHLAPTVSPSFYRQTPAVARAIQADGVDGRVMPPEDVGHPPPSPTGFGDALEYFRWDRQTLQRLTGASYGLDLAFNLDMEAFSTLRYTQLSVLVRGAPLREQLMLAGAAGVSHIVASTPLASSHLTPLELPADAPVHVVRNHLAQPRARIVAHLVAYEDFDALVRVVARSPDDFFASSALIDAALRGSVPPMSPTGPGAATIVADSGSELIIHTGGGGGYLIISDTYTPGWHATVDGEPVAIFPADVAFRGLAVPPGNRDVILRYNPWW